MLSCQKILLSSPVLIDRSEMMSLNHYTAQDFHFSVQNAIEPSYAFFDMDGTLVETDYANFLAYKKAIHKVLKVNNAITFNPSQRFDQQALRNLFTELSEDLLKEIIYLKGFYATEFLSETFVNSEVVKTFISMSETKTCVLVTNAQCQRAIETMRFHGLDKYLDTAICAEDRYGFKNKYLHALDQLGLSPYEVCVFENEDKEISHALKAGLFEKNIFKV